MLAQVPAQEQTIDTRGSRGKGRHKVWANISRRTQGVRMVWHPTSGLFLLFGLGVVNSTDQQLTTESCPTRQTGGKSIPLAVLNANQNEPSPYVAT
jgi:hypothetical protein